MNVPEILGVDAVRFVEPEFAAQTDSLFNDILAAAGGDEGRLLIDGDGEPIALAFHGPGGWVAASFLFRNPTVELIEQFENMNGEIFEEDRPVFSAAVREYYSNLLIKEVPPAIEDLNPVRRGILTALIEKHWGRGYHGPCIDCCCGSGVGSLVLRDLGYVPLSYDNDASLLTRGLATGRLLPSETLCIDATVASRYIEPLPRGIGIMMGVYPGYVGTDCRRALPCIAKDPHHGRDREGSPAHPAVGCGDRADGRSDREPGRSHLRSLGVHSHARA